jgi:hypothetical protein
MATESSSRGWSRARWWASWLCCPTVRALPGAASFAHHTHRDSTLSSSLGLCGGWFFTLDARECSVVALSNMVLWAISTSTLSKVVSLKEEADLVLTFLKKVALFTHVQPTDLAILRKHTTKVDFKVRTCP